MELKKEIKKFDNQHSESQEYDVLLASMKCRSALRDSEFRRPVLLPFQKKKVDKLIRWIYRKVATVIKENKEHASSPDAQNKDRIKEPVLPRFPEAGGRETFNWLKNNTKPKQVAFDKRVLEWRLGHLQVGDDFYSNISESQLRQWEGLLSGNPRFQDTISARDHSGLIYAIRYFTSKKPALVAKFLQSFTNPVLEHPARRNDLNTRIITQSG